jgi:hypothetical protein
VLGFPPAGLVGFAGEGEEPVAFLTGDAVENEQGGRVR